MTSRLILLTNTLNTRVEEIYGFQLFKHIENDMEIFTDLKMQVSSKANHMVLRDKIDLFWTLFVDRINDNGLQKCLSSYNKSLLDKNSKEQGGPMIRFGNLLALNEHLKQLLFLTYGILLFATNNFKDPS